MPNNTDYQVLLSHSFTTLSPTGENRIHVSSVVESCRFFPPKMNYSTIATYPNQVKKAHWNERKLPISLGSFCCPCTHQVPLQQWVDAAWTHLWLFSSSGSLPFVPTTRCGLWLVFAAYILHQMSNINSFFLFHYLTTFDDLSLLFLCVQSAVGTFGSGRLLERA